MGGVAAVVLAATAISRGTFDACWASLARRPVLAWSLDVVNASPAIDEVVLVVPASRLESACDLVRASRWPATRVLALPHPSGDWLDQMRAALGAIVPTRSHVVAHEGARPLVSSELLAAVLAEGTADERTVAVAGVPVKETLKLVDADGDVRQTPPRADLRQLQSPIVLPRAPLAQALSAGDPTAARGGELDALLAACAGCRIRLVRGSYDNILIHTRRDLTLAEDLLRTRAAPLK